jgi:serine/threonine-protein kinase
VFAVGERLGAYVIRHRIGAGGMGEVYLAEHMHISRRAAIKVLLPELSSRPDVVERFFNEARATSLLRHPNIVEILDCDVHASGRAYIVMEFLEGETLGNSLARIGSFARDIPTAAAIAGEIAAALAASHGKGIVHRDLKPDNIFLASTPEAVSPVRTKILDFGIAKLLGEGASGSRKTRTGSVLGTPVYMSPEQCRGAGRVDHRTDIYSLGCIIFELYAGQPPFVREGHGELIIAHNSEPPPELAALVPSVPPALAQLVARMLVKDPAQRTQTMSEVVAWIESILGVPAPQFAANVRPPPGFPVHGVPEPEPEPVPAPDPHRSSPSTRPDPANEPVPRTLLAQAGGTKVIPRGDTTLGQAAVAVPEAPAPRPSRTGLKVALGLGAAALAGAAVYVALGRPGFPTDVPETSTSAASASPAPVVSTPPLPSRPAPPAPSVVSIELEGAPAGLSVTLDGRPSAVPISVPAGPALHDLGFVASGFEPRVVTIDGSRNRSIVLDMKPVTVAASPDRAPSRRQASAAARVRPSRGRAAQPASKASEKDDAFRDF